QKSGPRDIHTGGGAYYAGPLHIAGDFVAGDKIVMAPAVGVAALHQLPAAPADFTGRAAELAELRAATQNQAVRIVGLRGLGGVGKTALAVVLANELAADYPDAQIVVDLLGTTKPLTAAAALAAVVRAFEPVARLPEDEAGLLAAYRSVLHEKRALLLLDDAAGREQVEPLLPPPGCLLLVTSRTRFALPGLKALNLDSLPADDAVALLLKIAPRIGQRAGELAELCGRLALALRLVGSALAEREELEPAEYAERLSDEKRRMAELDEVAASLSLSYGLLSEALQGLWRQLGVWVGDFDELAASSVWEMEPEAARERLGALLRYSLVAYDAAGRRWRLHDLARDFARSKLAPAEAEAAGGRHAAHYMLALAAANELYLQGGGDVRRGLGLFDLERANILAGWAWAAARSEEDAGAARLTGQYLAAGAQVLALRLHPQERIRWLVIGLAVARRAGDRGLEGQNLINLGNAYADLGQAREAVGYLEQALVIARETGDRMDQANALGNLGRMVAALGEPRRAIEYHQQQLA
ncbi:MAG: tetratricopeptide repeat protein, partial [Anaerolineales bacterium]